MQTVEAQQPNPLRALRTPGFMNAQKKKPSARHQPRKVLVVELDSMLFPVRRMPDSVIVLTAHRTIRKVTYSPLRLHIYRGSGSLSSPAADGLTNPDLDFTVGHEG